jgi:chaperonin GroES
MPFGVTTQAVTSSMYRPTSDRCLVRPDDAATVSKGGILIPESARTKREEATRGTMLAVGPGVLTKKGGRFPMVDVKPGDAVLYRKTAGRLVDFADGSFLIIREDDLMAVLDPE